MRSWSARRSLGDLGLRLRGRSSTSTTPHRREVVRATRTGAARLYVCGITPYDATHMGHAATYLAFDLLQRAWLDRGLEVRYTQNVTDVDDPLLERATAHRRRLDASWPRARSSCSART